MLSAFKNFGVTFLISALLFGIIAYFATGFVTGTVESILVDEKTELEEIMQSGDDGNVSDPITPDSNEDDKTPEGESFNFLLLTTNYRPDLYDTYAPSLNTMYDTDWYSVSPEETVGLMSGTYREIGLSSILLVRIDKEKRQVVYSSFTPQTRVYTSTGYHTLSEVYRLYGKATVAEYIHAITGLKFKYTMLINGYNLEELLELLGPTSVNVSCDLYFDGTYPTMQYETTAERVGSDGVSWTEHIPNSWLQSAGQVTLNADNFYNMTAVIEHSLADIETKSAYLIEIAQNYLTKIAGMEKDDRKILLAQMITREDEWENIEGLKLPETEVVETEEPLPWEVPVEEDASNESEADIKDPANRWKVELFEPDTPIAETDYTMNDYAAISELLDAVTYFEPVVITYPYIYRTATETSESYFEADTKAGLELYLSYRFVRTEEE